MGTTSVEQEWRTEALCPASDPELWFAAGAVEHKQAKVVCKRCPVRTPCLAYAMEAPVDHGIWGGLTGRERRRYRLRGPEGQWRVLVDA